MSGSRGGSPVLSATQVARLCDVDIKTIHNWANRGRIACWRTSGRHLRFRRIDVVDFLRDYGFEIPELLRHARPRVVAVEADAQGLAAMQRALSRRFEVLAHEHVVSALLALPASDADVLVLGDVSPLDADGVAAGVRSLDATRHLRIVTVGIETPGAAAWVPQGELAALKEALERVTGLE
jgi:excisionase family DNA binding protein